MLAGLTPGIDGEVFNVVDDDLPSSRQFLRLYKRHVRRFRSIYLPHAVSYALCCAVGVVFELVGGTVAARVQPQQLARVLGQDPLHQREAEDRGSAGRPRVSTAEALQRYFQSCREKRRHA